MVLQLPSQNPHKYQRLILRVAFAGIILTFSGCLLYLAFGHAVIKAAYESDAIFVEKMMAGRMTTPLDSYLEAADDLVLTITMPLILSALLAVALALNPAGTILATCTLTACFFIGEMGARLAFRDVTTTGDSSSYLARRWYGTVRQNSLGFRERDFQLEKQDHVYRIAVIGDSLTWGQGIAAEDRFSNQLQKRLNQAGAVYEVLNFGRPGADTADELRTLNEKVLPLKPDFILLQWFTNDIEGPDKPWLNSGMRLVPSDYVSRLLRRNSLLFWLVEQQWTRIQQALGVKIVFEEAVLADFADPHGVAWTEAKATLLEFINSCKRQGVPLGIVLFSDSYLRPSKLDFLTDRVVNICEESLTRCLDLRRAYASYRDDLRLWVNRLDPHPSALANSIATEELLNRFGEIWLNRPIPAVNN